MSLACRQISQPPDEEQRCNPPWSSRTRGWPQQVGARANASQEARECRSALWALVKTPEHGSNLGVYSLVVLLSFTVVLVFSFKREIGWVHHILPRHTAASAVVDDHSARPSPKQTV
jgi:hypothetical protein